LYLQLLETARMLLKALLSELTLPSISSKLSMSDELLSSISKPAKTRDMLNTQHTTP